MCLSIPGQILDVRESRALVQTEGRAVWCNALTQPDVRTGDYVLTHAGLILSIISDAEARRIRAEVAAVRGATTDPSSENASDRDAHPTL